MARRWPSTCCAPLGELWTRSRRKQIDCCRLVTRADSSRSFVCELRSPEASRVSCRSHRATGHHFSRCRESYFKCSHPARTSHSSYFTARHDRLTHRPTDFTLNQRRYFHDAWQGEKASATPHMRGGLPPAHQQLRPGQGRSPRGPAARRLAAPRARASAVVASGGGLEAGGGG